MKSLALALDVKVLVLERQVLGLGPGPQVLDNWLPHNNFTFCNYSIK